MVCNIMLYHGTDRQTDKTDKTELYKYTILSNEVQAYFRLEQLFFQGTLSTVIIYNTFIDICLEHNGLSTPNALGTDKPCLFIIGYRSVRQQQSQDKRVG